MRVGQPAKVKIDAFPDHELKGHVASFSPGTGNSFSILPAENATGNWVKVVQRLPVEIAIDEVPADLPLQHGAQRRGRRRYRPPAPPVRAPIHRRLAARQPKAQAVGAVSQSRTRSDRAAA